MRMAFEIDIRHVLPSISVPTLVVHRTGDRMCDVHNGRYLADHIPGARYVELLGDDHLPWAGADDVLDTVVGYLRDEILPRLGVMADDRPRTSGAPGGMSDPGRPVASPEARASVLFSEGAVAAASGDAEGARFLLGRAAEIAREAGAVRLEARARR